VWATELFLWRGKDTNYGQLDMGKGSVTSFYVTIEYPTRGFNFWGLEMRILVDCPALLVYIQLRKLLSFT